MAACTRLLLLDLDGTLIDSFADIRRGIIHAFAELDIQPDEEIIALSRRGVPLEVFYQRATGRDPGAAAEHATMQTFARAYRDFYLGHQENTLAYPEVADTLAWIRRQHPDVFIAVATSKRTDMAEAVIDDCGLTGFFHLVQGSENIAKKPDPTLLEGISERSGIPLAGAWMVGDTNHDVLAAQAAGCTAIAVTYGGWDRAELAPLAPDHLIGRFGELRDLLG